VPNVSLIADHSRINGPDTLDKLTIFGLFAVTAMLVTYALEKRSHWFVLAFAGSCLLGSTYGFLQGAWPFGLVEAVWAIVAARRWWQERTPR
jgi:hypothetical protein